MMTLPKELETALSRFMAERNVGREAAIRLILQEWLEAGHYLIRKTAAADTDTDETVQYPEFMDDASGGSGG